MQSKRESKKITVRFSKRLKSEMQQAIIRANYGLHGKSRWLQEAIGVFLQQPHFIELVEHGININQAELCGVEAFYLDSSTLQSIKGALMDIRAKYPLFEGVQSALIRASIVYRLMLNK